MINEQHYKIVDDEKQEIVNGNTKENNVKEEAILEDQLSTIAGNDAFNAFVEVFDKVPTEGKQRVGRDFELQFNCFYQGRYFRFRNQNHSNSL